MSNPSTHQLEPSIEWWCDVPVLRNPVLVRQAILIFGLAPLLPLALVGLAWLPEGIFGPFLDLVLLLYVLAFCLMATALFVSALLYHRGFRMHFQIDAQGFSVAQDDQRSHIASSLAVALGAAIRNPATMGAGMLSRFSSDVSGRWSALSGAKFHDGIRAIELRNGWRTVTVVYCNEEQYSQVSSFIRARLTSLPSYVQSEWISPPLRGLAWTLYVAVCVLPLYFLQVKLDAGLMPLMITTAFAAATVWFFPGLALGLGAGILCTVTTMSLAIAERGYLSEHEMLIGVLAIVGLTGLSSMGICAWLGHFVPILLADLDELSDGA